MADIKIDVSDILSKHLIPIMISGLVGLLTYQLFFHHWIWPTIIAILTFLIIKLVIWLFWKLYNKKKKKRIEENQNEKSKHQMSILAERALCFFHSLDQNHKAAAVALYKHAVLPNSCYNERFVAFGEGSAFIMKPYLSNFISFSYYPERRYIWCTNELESHNGAKSHYVIDPLFYEILKNYVENGIEDYPETINIMKYEKYYQV